MPQDGAAAKSASAVWLVTLAVWLVALAWLYCSPECSGRFACTQNDKRMMIIHVSTRADASAVATHGEAPPGLCSQTGSTAQQKQPHCEDFPRGFPCWAQQRLMLDHFGQQVVPKHASDHHLYRARLQQVRAGAVISRHTWLDNVTLRLTVQV